MKKMLVTSAILVVLNLSGCTAPQPSGPQVIRHENGNYYYVDIEECPLTAPHKEDPNILGCFDKDHKFLHPLKPMSDAEVNYYYQSLLQQQAANEARKTANQQAIMNSIWQPKNTRCTGVGPFVNCRSY